MTIEAMEQALEALLEINELSKGENAICLPAEIDGAMDALRTAIEAAEKQEAVAQIIALGQYEFPGLEWLSADHSFRAPIGTLLYAAPPAAQRQWVGLTDDEIFSVLGNLQKKYNGPPTEDSRVVFALAIEAKLKEKNT
jgi:hypothetical protein